jgi:phospholipid/cholesterol/gamma-HCH transport system ATP-binding protein
MYIHCTDYFCKKLSTGSNEQVHATSLVVSHDRDLAFGIASRIAVLEDGCILAIGTPDEIKRNSNPAVQYFLNASIAKMRTVSR